MNEVQHNADTVPMREDWIHLTGGGSMMPTRELAEQVNTLSMLLWESKAIDPPLTNAQAWEIATMAVETLLSGGLDA